MIQEVPTQRASEPRRLWKCSVCNREDYWSKTWLWFGSWKQIEETGNPKFVVCSDLCKVVADAKWQHPPEILDA